MVQGAAYSHLIGHLWRRGWRRPRLLGVMMTRLPYHFLPGSTLRARLKNQRRWAEGLAQLLIRAPVEEVKEQLADFAAIVPLRASMAAEIRQKKRTVSTSS